MKTMLFTAASIFAAALGTPALAQSSSSCSMHHASVESRGDHVMGFDHDKTTHHFHLTPSGGVIEVTANAESDTASRDAIRGHLSHIATMFAEGDFEAPMLIHDRVPPGVPVLKEKGSAIRWTLEEIPLGWRDRDCDRGPRGAESDLRVPAIPDRRPSDRGSPEINDGKAASASK